MYAYFIGNITFYDEECVFLETNAGIGYRIFTPGRIIADLVMNPENRKIYTYTAVKEDAIMLYGFLSVEEVNLFRSLITVSGIGPKGAISLLSIMDSNTLKACVLSEDAASLSKAPGIGKKTGERLIIDLRDKFMKEDTAEIILSKPEYSSISVKQDNENPLYKEAFEALSALGFSRNEVVNMLKNVEITDDKEVGNIIFEALQYK